MKTFVEASFKVDVAGLPPIFMDARSSVEIRKKLRKQLKFPDDIENIERITKGEKIKSFKDRLKSTLSAKGQDVEEAVQVDEVSQKTLTAYIKKASDQLEKGKVKDVNKIGNRAVGIDTAVHGIRKNAAKGKTIKGTIGAPKNVPEAKASEDMLMDPKRMAKKTKFLSPQNTDKLKMDLAALKKKLGLNHPLNKPKTEAKDSAEYDEEGGMVKGQLRTMIDAAQELHDSLDKDDNLPEWVQSKVTKATDYIDSVRDYMASEKDDD